MHTFFFKAIYRALRLLLAPLELSDETVGADDRFSLAALLPDSCLLLILASRCADLPGVCVEGATLLVGTEDRSTLEASLPEETLPACAEGPVVNRLCCV